MEQWPTDLPPATGMIFDGTVSKLKYTLSGVSKPKGTFNYFVGFYIRTHCICYISGASLLQSPMVLGKCDLKCKITELQGLSCYSFYFPVNHFGLNRGDHNGEVTGLHIVR